MARGKPRAIFVGFRGKVFPCKCATVRPNHTTRTPRYLLSPYSAGTSSVVIVLKPPKPHDIDAVALPASLSRCARPGGLHREPSTAARQPRHQRRCGGDTGERRAFVLACRPRGRRQSQLCHADHQRTVPGRQEGRQAVVGGDGRQRLSHRSVGLCSDRRPCGDGEGLHGQRQRSGRARLLGQGRRRQAELRHGAHQAHRLHRDGGSAFAVRLPQERRCPSLRSASRTPRPTRPGSARSKP